MKLSISNIAWDAAADDEVLEKLPGLGCRGLEIAPTRIFPETPYGRLKEAEEWAAGLKEKTGLPVCSMQSIWYRRSESIFGSSREVEALIQYTGEAVLFAGTVGCPNLVFGCPKNRIIPEGKNPEDSIPFFRAVGEFAAQHGAVIALEAVPVSYGTNFLNATEDLYEFVKAVDSPGIRMNLDFGTMLVNGEDVSCVGRYVPVVSHVHISENGLAGVEHRNEHRVFLKALKEAGYDRYVSIEMRNQEDPQKVYSVVRYVGELITKAGGEQ